MEEKIHTWKGRLCPVPWKEKSNVGCKRLLKSTQSSAVSPAVYGYSANTGNRVTHRIDFGAWFFNVTFATHHPASSGRGARAWKTIGLIQCWGGDNSLSSEDLQQSNCIKSLGTRVCSGDTAEQCCRLPRAQDRDSWGSVSESIRCSQRRVQFSGQTNA